MNLSHLQYFRELAQVQHYTKAAHNLFISQPTLSHSIAALEDELGVKLFEKNGRTVKLTDDGALFAQYVERSLDALEDGIGELEKRKGAFLELCALEQSIRSVQLSSPKPYWHTVAPTAILLN